MDAESAIRDFLEREHGPQTAFLAELVRLPSDNPPGDCAHHAERTAALLEGLGLRVERHPVPEERANAAGLRSATNLVVRHRFGDGPVIALNAHGDAVPPGDGWTHDPYAAEIVDGWMYGRGVAVSKSDIATYAWALLALCRSGAALRGAVELHITYDEESGGTVGPALLLREGVSRPDFAICAGFSYGVVTAHNGCLHFEIVVRGRSAHAALPGTGIDALEAANAVLSALYAWRRGLAGRVSAIPGIGAPQLTIGMIAGGINTNVVPDRVMLRLDRRITPEEDPKAAEEELRSLISEAVSSHPAARVDIERLLYAAPLRRLAGVDPLAGALCRRASEIIGEPIGEIGVPLYTDARYYAAAGIPVVLYGAGPRSIEAANAHRADERLPLADLHNATAVVALALHDLLRVDHRAPDDPAWHAVFGPTATRDAFVAALDGIYEHSSWVAAKAWAGGPFADRAALAAALSAAVAGADQEHQLALIRAHPELADRAAVAAGLTPASAREQREAGLDRCTPEEYATLIALNRAYREKFGFPFIIAVRGETRQSIIDALARRLAQSREQELAECLRQIDRIAGFRLAERFPDH